MLKMITKEVVSEMECVVGDRGWNMEGIDIKCLKMTVVGSVAVPTFEEHSQMTDWQNNVNSR